MSDGDEYGEFKAKVLAWVKTLSEHYQIDISAAFSANNALYLTAQKTHDGERIFAHFLTSAYKLMEPCAEMYLENEVQKMAWKISDKIKRMEARS
jgi:hypothetical protein